MTVNRRKIRRFHRLLFRWYEAYQRDLPWRTTHDPYKVLVSEVMLQQTQVDRVAPKYDVFIRQYPTARSLEQAGTAEVIKLWSGLGYNRRAIYLKRAAEVVIRDWQGKWPKTVKELKTLPGVGPYTASAILSFAFNRDVPLADVNIKRVIGRIFIGRKWRVIPERRLLAVVGQVLPKGKARLFPHAVMDLGAALRSDGLSLAVWRREFPELFLKEPRIEIRQQPWQGSNRQLRGTILRTVQSPVTIRSLRRRLDIPTSKLVSLVKAMAREGLIVFDRHFVSLP